ncbi:hypothetical protein HMPREF2531_03223 [Bacteroides intestinalis]|uniref:Uncharacterized protein n=1 Tax=Bacteroides intestinalis TaxID=329854 RepID=A0A139L3L2_9BACE|nr:hypothetical protein HMPREF2531_03223 [Bacteroides intestinalis]
MEVNEGGFEKTPEIRMRRKKRLVWKRGMTNRIKDVCRLYLTG